MSRRLGWSAERAGRERAAVAAHYDRLAGHAPDREGGPGAQR